jgi:RsiW-degrading membrane proteinase PrsW (M82 family)
MFLLSLALAPGFAISIFIYWKDKFEKEPRALLIKSFLLGMISTVPAAFFELFFNRYVLPEPDEIISIGVYSFAGIGIIEEGCKYFFLRSYAYRKSEFNEPFDGITYAVMVSMGFATLENLLYVFQQGAGTAITRMFTAVPAHATFGIIMGYFLGLEKMKGKKYFGLAGLLLAATLHAAYDFFLLTSYIPGMWLGAVLSVFIGIRFSLRAIRLHQNDSPFKNK